MAEQLTDEELREIRKLLAHGAETAKQSAEAMGTFSDAVTDMTKVVGEMTGAVLLSQQEALKAMTNTIRRTSKTNQLVRQRIAQLDEGLQAQAERDVAEADGS